MNQPQREPSKGKMHNENLPPAEDGEAINLAISDLMRRAGALVSELETFRQHLRSIRQEQDVELAQFRGAVQAEVGMLQRLSKKLDDVNTGHVARSSNIPFLESIWNNAKKSRRLKAVQKGLYFNSPNKPTTQSTRHGRMRSDKGERLKAKNAKVTVVSSERRRQSVNSLTCGRTSFLMAV